MAMVTVREKQLRRGVRRVLRRNEIFFFLTVLFLVGILLGACLVRVNGEDWQGFVGQIASEFAQSRRDQTFSQTVIHSFLSSAFYLLMLFLCGFCVVGQPLICLVALFRGLGYGMSAGGIYSMFGLQGMGYTALMLLPNCVMSGLCLLRAGQSGIRFSTGLYGAMKGSGRMMIRPYCMEFLLLSAIIFISALLDGICSLLFGGLFPYIG